MDIDFGTQSWWAQRLVTFTGYRQGAVRRLPLEQFTAAWLRDHGTVRPVVLPAKDGSDAATHLGMHLPPNTASVDSILEALGSERQVFTLDVATQKAGPMLTLHQWLAYWSGRELDDAPAAAKSKSKHKPSLLAEDDEADSAALRRRRAPQGPAVTGRLLDLMPTPAVTHGGEAWFQAPAAVRAVDLAAAVGYESPIKDSNTLNGTQQSLGMSPNGAYSDFNLPPSGASTWIHMKSGHKSVALLPPTAKNLSSYVAWCIEGRHSEVFLPEQCEGAAYVELSPGDTLFIPPGWLLASTTANAAVLACGHFLRQDSLAVHFEAWRVEEYLGVHSEARYPGFKPLMWKVALAATQQLQTHMKLDPEALQGLIQERKARAVEEDKVLAKNPPLRYAHPTANDKAAGKKQQGAAKQQRQQHGYDNSGGYEGHRGGQRKKEGAPISGGGGENAKRVKRQKSPTDSFIESEEEELAGSDVDEYEWAPGASREEEEANPDSEDEDYDDIDEYDDWGEKRKNNTRNIGNRGSTRSRRGQQALPTDAAGGGSLEPGKRQSTRFSGRVPPSLAAVLHAEEEEEEEEEEGAPEFQPPPSAPVLKLKVKLPMKTHTAAAPSPSPQQQQQQQQQGYASPTTKVKIKLKAPTTIVPQVDGPLDSNDGGDSYEDHHQGQQLEPPTNPEPDPKERDTTASDDIVVSRFEELSDADEQGLAALVATLRQWLCCSPDAAENGLPSDIADPKDMIARLMVYMSQLHYDTTWDPLVPLAPAGAAPNLKGDIDTGGGLQGEGGDGAAGDEGGGDNVVVEESKGPKTKLAVARGMSQPVKQGKPMSVKNRLMKKLRM